MGASGYWQPVVQCKNPECFFGKPIFLPYPNLPNMNESQPEWPKGDWGPFLICGHCGHGYLYSNNDVEWGSNRNKNGLPEHHLVLYVELQCAQKGCQQPVKLYLGFDDSKKEKHRDRMLEIGSGEALCAAGHARARSLRVTRSIFVNAIA